MDEDFILARQKVEIWSKGVLEQISRIRSECLNIDKSTDRVEKWDFNVLRINDDHFLKIAINNAMIWLQEFNKYIGETNNLYNELSKIQEIKDLRNMAEHEIEYYEGTGRKQGEYINKETNLSASETGILEGEYLIGGRLSMSYIEEKFKEIYDVIYKNNFTISSYYFEKKFGVKL